MRRAIFLDRDGTLNKAFIKNGLPFSPSSFSEFEILPGIKESILRLKKLNFVCLVVTNQPDVSRGKIKKNVVIKMNRLLKSKIKLDDIFVCYHDDRDNCECRKPKPGLIFQAAKKWNIELQESYMIGDTWKDGETARNANVDFFLLEKDYNLDYSANHRINKIKDISQLMDK